MTLLLLSCLLILLGGLVLGFIQFGLDERYMIMATYEKVFHVGISGYYVISQLFQPGCIYQRHHLFHILVFKKQYPFIGRLCHLAVSFSERL